MMTEILSKYSGRIAIASGLIAASIYLLMTTVTLAHITAVSGQVPFDMRPTGYGPTEAVTLLNALGVEGRSYYLSHQIALDTAYPATLAITLIATIFWLGQRLPDRKLVRIGIALSVLSALFDYIENLAIMVMIWSWPEVSTALVYAASSATVLKSLSTTLAVLLVILVGVSWARLSRARLRP